MSENYRAKPRQVIHEIGKGENWRTERLTCRGCGALEFAPRCRTSRGRMCVQCALKELQKKASGRKTTLWAADRVLTALSDVGSLSDRVAVMTRIREVAEKVGREYPDDLPLLYRGIVDNLKYENSLPLAKAIRGMAVEAAKLIGKPLLPLLLKVTGGESEMYRVRAAVCALSIDPFSANVQNFLKAVLIESEKEARTRLLDLLGGFKDPATIHTLVEVSNHPDPWLREAAERLVLGSAKGKKPVYSAKTGKIGTGQAAEAFTPLESSVLGSYGVRCLERLYDECFYRFHKKRAKKGAYPRKEVLVRLTAGVFSRKEDFRKMLSLLPAPVFEIMMVLSWEGGLISVSESTERFGAAVFDGVPCGGGRLKTKGIRTPYLLFEIRSPQPWEDEENTENWFLTLPRELGRLFRTHLPRPEGYDLTPVPDPEKNRRQLVHEEKVLADGELWANYVGQGNLKILKTGNVQIASLRGLKRNCDIAEFYPASDKNLALIRTRLIAMSLRHHGFEAGSEEGNAPRDFLKILTMGLLSNSGLDFTELLFHLKGMKDLRKQGCEIRGDVTVSSLMKLLEAFPVGKWIEWDNILRFTRFREMDFAPVKRHDAGEYLYYDEVYQADGIFLSGERKALLNDDNFDQAVTLPFLKGIFFLLAAIGVVDIAYDNPGNDVLKSKRKKYLSVFDGLGHVRFTKLGQYLTGMTDRFRVEKKTEPGNITFLDNRLIATLTGEDRKKRLFLDRVGEKISAGNWKVTFRSFLGRCRSREDVETQIAMLKLNVSCDLPPVWEAFLEQVKERVSPLSSETGMYVFKVSESSELVAALTRDPALKELVLKAENYHILVPAANLSKVKERLLELGFFPGEMI